MVWVLQLAVLAAAGVLMYAGCAKLAAVPTVVPTVRALGVPPAAAAPLVVGVACAEISCAVLMLVDHGVVAGSALAALALTFAGAGVLGLRAGEPIRCGCFGRVRRSTVLGARQILMLAVWLPVAGLVVALDDTTPTHGLLLANAAAAAVALVGLRDLVPIARRSRALRDALGPVT